MKVVLLCGGLGTRLREETEFRPKPMVDVGGRPILWHIMKIYAHYGFADFVLCLGYRGNSIKEYFLSYEAMNNDFTICLGDKTRIHYHSKHEEQDYNVTLADTGADTMTGGRVKRVARYLDGDTFMVTYGDGLADVNIRSLLDYHRRHGRLATITAVQPMSRYGMLDVHDDGTVHRFLEKPQSESWVNAGYFVFQRDILNYITDDDTILEREPLERLAGEGHLMTYRHRGFFYAMDTYREYKALNDIWTSGKAPWKVWER
jgi:glucose-1-phosphate cytidylyltransferase